MRPARDRDLVFEKGVLPESKVRPFKKRAVQIGAVFVSLCFTSLPFLFTYIAPFLELPKINPFSAPPPENRLYDEPVYKGLEIPPLTLESLNLKHLDSRPCLDLVLRLRDSRVPKDREIACSCLDRVIENEIQTASAEVLSHLYTLRGDLLIRQRESGKAILDLETASKLNPGNLETAVLLLRALEEEDHKLRAPSPPWSLERQRRIDELGDKTDALEKELRGRQLSLFENASGSIGAVRLQQRQPHLHFEISSGQPSPSTTLNRCKKQADQRYTSDSKPSCAILSVLPSNSTRGSDVATSFYAHLSGTARFERNLGASWAVNENTTGACNHVTCTRVFGPKPWADRHALGEPGAGNITRSVSVLSPNLSLVSTPYVPDRLGQDDPNQATGLWVQDSSEEVLAVGVNGDGTAGLERLKYAAADAQRVSAALRDLDFRSTILTNTAATRPKILAELSRVVQVSRPGDVFVLYFSGHGFTDTNGHPVLVTGGGAKDAHIETMSLEEIAYILSFHRGRAIVLLDNCLNLTQIKSGTRDRPVAGPNRPTFILAGAPGSRVIESPRLGSGLFTFTLLRYLEQQRTQSELDFAAMFRYSAAETSRLAHDLYGVSQHPQWLLVR